MKARKDHYQKEGLNTVRYEVVEARDLPLYTWLHVGITAPVYRPINTTTSPVKPRDKPPQ